ncbi:MAG: EAL domain-containing protein [Roseovarius sp.]
MAKQTKHTTDPPEAPEGARVDAPDLFAGDSDQGPFGLILSNMRDGVMVQDVQARVEWMNPACEKMFGWSLEELRGKRLHEFALPQDARPAPEEVAAFRYDVDRPNFQSFEITRHMRRDGSRFWNQQNFTVIRLGEDDNQTKVVITCRDVTEQVDTETTLRQAQVDLEHAAHHDDLTGLANRTKLGDYLDSEQVARHIRHRNIGVLQIDIDKFKDINDTLGHAAGDAVLCHVAAAMRANSEPDDLICRTGGDEFLLISLRTTTEDQLIDRAEDLRRAISWPLTWSSQVIRVGTSIGVSLASTPGVTGEALLQMADQALYAAKHEGRNQVVIYTPALGQAQKVQQQLARDLKRAVADNQFEIYLQPQLHLSQNEIVGSEALLRWNHPERGVLGPHDFLVAAERNGLLTEIDYISMNLALDALVKLRNSGFSDHGMSINVSSSILADVNYPGLLDWALQCRGIEPNAICVEILETTILDDSGLDVVTAIDRLKRLGVRVALDDFGTGYAGLAHMSAFDIDAIKLDRSMISRLEDDPRNRIIIRSIIRLGMLLNMKVVAEGVETYGQLEILRRTHCPLIQGFGLARPMIISETINWLEAVAKAGEVPFSGIGVVEPLSEDTAL